MASNFQIYRHRTRDSLHLKLEGDFDGSSAHELINALKEDGAGFYQVAQADRAHGDLRLHAAQHLPRPAGEDHQPGSRHVVAGRDGRAGG